MFSAFFMEKNDIVRRKSTCSSCTLLVTNCLQEFSYIYMCDPCSSVGKESVCNARDPGSIPELERSSQEGNGNPLQYSCLENPTDRGACLVTVHGVTRVRWDLVTKPPLNHCHTANTILWVVCFFLFLLSQLVSLLHRCINDLLRFFSV